MNTQRSKLELQLSFPSGDVTILGAKKLGQSPENVPDPDAENRENRENRENVREDGVGG